MSLSEAVALREAVEQGEVAQMRTKTQASEECRLLLVAVKSRRKNATRALATTEALSRHQLREIAPHPEHVKELPPLSVALAHVSLRPGSNTESG